MNNAENPDIVPRLESKGTETFPLRKVCVKLYLNEKEFIDYITMAEKAQTRPRGLKPFRMKPHGFSHERIANTKGLVKFIKKIVIPYWKSGEEDRKLRTQKLVEEAERLGMEVK